MTRRDDFLRAAEECEAYAKSLRIGGHPAKVYKRASALLREAAEISWRPISEIPMKHTHVLVARFIDGRLIEIATAVFIYHEGKPWGWQSNQKYGRMIKWPVTHWANISSKLSAAQSAKEAE